MVKKMWLHDYINELTRLIAAQHNSQSKEEHALYQKKIDELVETMQELYG